MTSPETYLKNIKELRSRLLDESERIIYANEKEISNLNIIKIEEGQGSDGTVLNSNNPKFTGRYKLGTQLLNPSKKVGDLYTFLNTGEFLGNFQVEVLPSLTQIEIFSTGTGSGLKADFFKGYKNLYGLTKEDQQKLNYEIILPKLLDFINTYI